MDAFPEKIMKYVDQHALLSPGDRIVVGLSGGADSVCLLLILQVISGKMPLSLCAVHVEHGIRGRRRWKIRPFAVSCVKRVAFRFGKYTVMCPEWPGGKGSLWRRRAAKPVMRPLPGCGRNGAARRSPWPITGKIRRDTAAASVSRHPSGGDAGHAPPAGCDHPSAAGCQPGRDRGVALCPGCILADGFHQPHRRLCQKPCPAPGSCRKPGRSMLRPQRIWPRPAMPLAR